MTQESKLAAKLSTGEFVVTAEYLPGAIAENSLIDTAIENLGNGPAAVNVADNPHGPVLSSLAGSVALNNAGIEPIFQIVTRDRNRIAIQSDLLGASSMGIKNILCLSGYHQTVAGCPESANVYDIDSIQMIAMVNNMNDQGTLLDGTKINGSFSMNIGAVANPDLKPVELNMIRVVKKIDAGADFIQTQAIFDLAGFEEWLAAAANEGVTEKAAILSGILPLESAEEAESLCEKYTEINIPEEIITRLKTAGDNEKQKKEGVAIAVELIQKIKAMKGIKGIHLLSGGKEALVKEIMQAI